MILAILTLFATDLGRAGETFPVQEKSFFEYIQEQILKSGFNLQEYGKEVEDYIRNPTPVENITPATSKRSFLFDPTHTIQKDIIVDGKLIAKKGDTINPLDRMDFDEPLLFFDGSDPKQIAWAKEQPENSKWILIKGSPLDLEAQENRPVYFDQMGVYIARFQVKHYPAKVSQQGNQFLVVEGL